MTILFYLVFLVDNKQGKKEKVHPGFILRGMTSISIIVKKTYWCGVESKQPGRLMWSGWRMSHVDRAEDGRWPGGSNDQQDMALPLLMSDTENSCHL